MSKTITIKGFLIGYHFSHQSDPNEIHWSYSTSYGHKLDRETVAVIPHSFDVEVPDINVVAAQVAGLEAEKQQALEAYQRTVADINERLGKLLAITNEVEA